MPSAHRSETGGTDDGDDDDNDNNDNSIEIEIVASEQKKRFRSLSIDATIPTLGALGPDAGSPLNPSPAKR
jgi:hypothetical protein